MKYKIIISILTAFLGAFGVAFAQPAQYTPMTAPGYQMKRIKADSTLHIPSFCGEPTIKGSTAIDGAIAIDTCGNILYKWTRAAGWSQITSGTTIDTTSLSNRIDARVKYSDTAAMLANYMRDADTLSLSNRINGRIDSLRRSNDSIFARKNGAFVFQYKDSTGGGAAVVSDTAKVVIAKVHNAETTTLTRGTVVYLFGANGDVASAKRANNKQDATSARTFGVVRRDIAAGDTGYIVTQGQIDKLNLGAYNEGDILWLDSLDGQFTKVKPVAPYHTVLIGITERANAGNGLAYIKIQNGVELDEIHDCLIVTPINNQVLAYSDTQQLWKNRNIYSIVDTASFLTPYLRKSDTTAMLTPYLRKSDTTAMLTPYLRKSDTTTMLTPYLRKSDTTALARKQLAAYSFNANATPTAANGSVTAFRDTSGTYTGAITWTGTTAPSGATNHSFRIVQIGRMVTVTIFLVYATNGGAVGQVTLDLPSGAPAVAEPPGLTGANQNIYPVLVWFASSTNVILSNAARGFIRNNPTNTANDIIIQMSSSAPNTAHITVTYYTN